MIFIDNKYTKWYNGIISTAHQRVVTGYTERHHIIPRSIGGSDSDTNLVTLTAREHFICHWLLVKMVVSVKKRKMQLALHRMCSSRHYQYRYKVTSRVYELVRKHCSDAMSGKNNPMYGRKRTPEEIKNISDGVNRANEMHGPRVISETHKKSISKAISGRARPDMIAIMRENNRKINHNTNTGKRWYNDGCKSYLKKDCPEGCVPGRLS